MTTKRTILVLFCIVSLRIAAQKQQSQFNDIYHFIENVELFKLNQTEAHTRCFSYNSVKEALNYNKVNSPHAISLNGMWKFNFSNTPEDAPMEFFTHAYNDKKWSLINVPSNWEMQGFGDPLFRNEVHPFQSNPPFVPREYNPTGLYRKSFSVPSNWKGKRIYLRMEKTASASFVWVNGQEVGYNEGAQEPAEYDITEFVNSGKNLLAVKVIKYSDGVYLECQDYWRMAGVFDDVWLYAKPNIQISDWYATTDLDENYRNAELKIEMTINNLSKKNAAGYKIRTSLFDANNTIIESITLENIVINSKDLKHFIQSKKISNPKKWTAETPNLYRLTMELINASGKIEEVVTARIGFKETEIRNQVFYLNGKAIKLNGINTHMQHPDLGHTMDDATIRKDFELFKRFNINCIRISHYPPVTRYLELADEYGFYLIDETGDEAHATEYLCDKTEWEPMYRDRAKRMVMRDRNHASILFWSAGNESGEGKNICAVIDEGRKYDKTRYWMYGGNAFAHSCEDIIGPRYPSPFELKAQIGLVPESVDSRPSLWTNTYRWQEMAVVDWTSIGI